MEHRFKVGDEVRKGDAIYTVTATGPWHRKPDERPWYSLRGSEPEQNIRAYFDAWDDELEPCPTT